MAEPSNSSQSLAYRCLQITRGLAFLNELISTTDFDRRKALLKGALRRDPLMFEAAILAKSPETYDDLVLLECPEHHIKLWTVPPHAPDPDQGPMLMCKGDPFLCLLQIQRQEDFHYIVKDCSILLTPHTCSRATRL